jgi:hypothetical protein
MDKTPCNMKNIFISIGLIGLLLSGLPGQVWAWGRQGHHLVAQLAMHQVSPQARERVLQILNGMTPEAASTWMDDVRRDTAYRYTAPWHYINIEKDSSYRPGPGSNVINALQQAFAELKQDTTSLERQRFDVLVLFHLCGDLLQPLHVGYGNDKGGNDTQVNYKGRGTNLHSIWDSGIIEADSISLSNLIDTTQAPTKKSLRKLRRSKVDFVKELKAGRKYLPDVYDFEGARLDDAYMQKNKPVVIADLQEGGRLLAACLEQLFGVGKRA